MGRTGEGSPPSPSFSSSFTPSSSPSSTQTSRTSPTIPMPTTAPAAPAPNFSALGYFKNSLYNLITWSGVLVRLVPILEPMMVKLKLVECNSNYTVTDEGGATMKLTKYNGRLFPSFGEKALSGVSNLTIRDDDVLLCGYPKTGCHWVYEILIMVVTGKIGLTKHGKEVGGMVDAMPPIILDSLPSPRVLNSHLLYEELPAQIREKKTKVILTMRNPKDTVVSYYNHVIKVPELYDYRGKFEHYFKLWMAGTLDYGSYFDYVLSWDEIQKTQGEINPVLIVEYEKLKEDPVPIVKEIGQFLGKPVSDAFAKQILEECSFSRMKQQRQATFASVLFRKGKLWLSNYNNVQCYN